MSILIKGMEMPKTCFKCKLSRITPSIYAFCLLTEKCYPADETPPSECHLVPVPPHGRLGDMDALKEKIEALIDKHLHGYTKSTWDFVCELRSIISAAPTIIPAEEGEA